MLQYWYLPAILRSPLNLDKANETERDETLSEEYSNPPFSIAYWITRCFIASGLLYDSQSSYSTEMSIYAKYFTTVSKDLLVTLTETQYPEAAR